MINLLACQPAISKLLRNRHLLLLLDFDGTLAPLCNAPAKAALQPGTKETLRGLLRRPDTTLAIVSGRDLHDLKSKIGLRGLIYAANHGFRIQGCGLDFRAKLPTAVRNSLRNLCRELAARTRGIKGTLVENKEFSAALHYRLVRGRNLRAIKPLIAELTASSRRLGLKTKEGKKVLEFLPPFNLHKGTAVLNILRLIKKRFNKPVLAIYFGDDATDEDAFRTLTGKGITVRIGKTRSSAAGYYLTNPRQLRQFLTMILAAMH